MDHFVIRNYRVSDNTGVRELYKLASIDSEIGYRNGPWEHDFDDIESHYAGGIFLVGVINEQIVTMGGVQKITDDIAHIRRMRTHPAYRRKGFAGKLLIELENESGKRGFRILRLRTSTQQIMAQAFYKKNTFKPIEQLKTFYTEGGGKKFEVIWYEKQLSENNGPGSSRHIR
jgi:ribosomal protein S18 acetylase RimI-like enzyme